jgi:hypothetical protein
VRQDQGRAESPKATGGWTSPETTRRVLWTLEWVQRRYPVDADRVSLRGESIGGIGTLAIGFSTRIDSPRCMRTFRRYVLMHQRREYWEFLGDQVKGIIDEGYTGPWLDCAVSSWINHSDAYGVRVTGPYDVDLKRPLDRDTYREY